MDEKLETIVGLENTVKKLKAKNKKYIEENADIAKRYQIIKQQLINTVFFQYLNKCLYFMTVLFFIYYRLKQLNNLIMILFSPNYQVI